MPTITEDVSNIQGIILRGYQNLTSAMFLLLSIEDLMLTRHWLKQIVDGIQYGGLDEPSGPSLNIAFTFEGLQKLGMNADELSQFSAAFQSGMTTEHRQRILADTAANRSSPDTWFWGAPGGPAVHVLVMYYCKSNADLVAGYENELAPAFNNGGLKELYKLQSANLPNDTEHFGFKDGISNPHIAGLGNASDAVKPGEFLLGYQNEYGIYAERPLIDGAIELPRDEEGSNKGDFGRNGSYLVVRQLQQDVYLFWKTLNDRSTAASMDLELLAAKMVGRWRSGAPLALFPSSDNPASANENDFMYEKDDRGGLNCPIGAHIRRTNPRDSLDPEPGSSKSVDVNHRHRIIRRGRSYGDPITVPIDPQKILANQDDLVERGLFFMCFNANLTRQFEFIQNSWLNNPKFAGLYGSPDPLLGDRKEGTISFTIPAEPVRQKVNGLPQFVRTRGGSYFFMPGKQSLNYLANLTD